MPSEASGASRWVGRAFLIATQTSRVSRRVSNSDSGRFRIGHLPLTWLAGDANLSRDRGAKRWLASASDLNHRDVYAHALVGQWVSRVQAMRMREALRKSAYRCAVAVATTTTAQQCVQHVNRETNVQSAQM